MRVSNARVIGGRKNPSIREVLLLLRTVRNEI